jgi:hypothetical protein
MKKSAENSSILRHITLNRIRQDKAIKAGRQKPMATSQMRKLFGQWLLGL